MESTAMIMLVDAFHFVNAIKRYFLVQFQVVREILKLVYSWLLLMLEFVFVLQLRVISGYIESFQSSRIVLAPIF